MLMFRVFFRSTSPSIDVTLLLMPEENLNIVSFNTGARSDFGPRGPRSRYPRDEHPEFTKRAAKPRALARGISDARRQANLWSFQRE